MEQSPVEWLEDELKANLKKVILEGDSELMESLFAQAKEMEKEQKHSEYTRGFDDGYKRKQEQLDYMRGKNHSCSDNFK